MKTNSHTTKEKKLVISSRTENLSPIREFIQETAVEAGMKSKSTNDMMLAVDEACTNIIKHAYKSYPEGKIIITIKTFPEKIIIKITDYGNAFHPEVIPEPDIQEYYRQKRVGGLGMYLMKTLMDEVKYISIPGKYNQVLLTKNLNSSH